MINIYDIGDVPSITGVFTDGGAAIDPDTVQCMIKTPAGTTTTYIHGVDAAVVKDGPGNYHIDVPITTSGRWHYRWEGWTAHVPPIERGGGEGYFEVRLSAF